MTNYYERWLETELTRLKAARSMFRKSNLKYLVFILLGSIIFLAFIGYLAGGITLAISNVKYGIIFGFIIDIIFGSIIFCVNPPKRFQNQLKRQTAKHLRTESEKESFASQMMGLVDGIEIKQFTCKLENGLKNHFFLTKDYILEASESGTVKIARLKDVERIELNVQNYSYSINTGYSRTYVNKATYPIFFYYHTTAQNKKGKPNADQIILFSNKDTRTDVVGAIEELTQE